MASSSSSSSSRDGPSDHVLVPASGSSSAPVLTDYRERHRRRYEQREAEVAREEQEDADLELAKTLQSHEELRLQQEMDLKHAEEVHRVQEMEQRQRELNEIGDPHVQDDSGVRRPMRTGYTERLINDSEFTVVDGEPSDSFPFRCPLIGIFRTTANSERELLPLRDPDDESPAESLTTRLLINRQGFGPMRWITAALTDDSDAQTAWSCCRCFGGDCWCTKRMLSACLMLLTVSLMLFIIVAITMID
ncbi:hypothetical protein Pmar_PMAR003622 [Perkinsus marinus ATCC 50983]|uniref:Uncharacterized protein n=1 Tax=Perkinsus marinus (strain ATCC 50983 / TXsc) TaxID=423536 RepID=C5KHU7_PERM5|nr:hypothetical protein Pmar_PMAR003622 [Perkinsus marinus ATCC 50983]EER16159.1 hypothetical protein Pmar_PMAR003622 [Perkinsus marinus ATCC 50983]|eukprot:XP_002784363.1 hypothetical protein Pmar_PMAR003622 [Perkinsus marinus ATCC 50983]